MYIYTMYEFVATTPIHEEIFTSLCGIYLINQIAKITCMVNKHNPCL